MKNFKYYIVITLIILIIIYYVLKNKSNNMKEVLILARKHYNDEVVSNAEKIFRLETNHFKSNQFKKTFSPGMEKFSNNFPFGWRSLEKFWNNLSAYKPNYFLPFTENRTGYTKYFIVFPSFEASFMTLCEFLKNFENNPGRWFSLNAKKQYEYNNKINKISPKIFNEIKNSIV